MGTALKYLPLVCHHPKLISALFMAGLISIQPFVYAHSGAQPDEKESKADCRTVFNFTFPKLIEFMSEIDCNQFISSNSDWVWRYPNSYFDRPFISAFSPLTRKAEPGTRFF